MKAHYELVLLICWESFSSVVKRFKLIGMIVLLLDCSEAAARTSGYMDAVSSTHTYVKSYIDAAVGV